MGMRPAMLPYLPKPVPLAQLAACLERYVASAKAHDSNPTRNPDYGR